MSPDELRVAPGVLVPVNRGPDAVQCDLNGYLRRILTARVYEIAVRAGRVRCVTPQPVPCCLLSPLPCGTLTRRAVSAHGTTTQVETPLDVATRLSERVGNGNTILLKREDMQPVFSFKARRCTACFPTLQSPNPCLLFPPPCSCVGPITG